MSRFAEHPNPGGGRDPQRIDLVLAVLEEVWRANTDMRLAQLVNAAAQKAGAPQGKEWLTEDGPLLEQLETLLDRN